MTRAAAPGRGARVLAISGGVGGAKLALGLYRVLESDRLTVIANTADDFVHLGLHVSPDVDTVMYTLAGISNPQAGWGRAGETWHFMDALAELGGDTWFRLGDQDLATNVERTRRLSDGGSLTDVTRAFSARLGVQAEILPMTDATVRTVVVSAEGQLPFQEYFVKLACAPVVRGFRFDGADAADASNVIDALNRTDLDVVVVCPSNPYISIDPILALPGVRPALAACRAPVVAVSPIVGRDAIKGPTAKMMRELGLDSSPTTVAAHYRDFIDGFVVERGDADAGSAYEVPVHRTSIVMNTLADRERLAGETLDFAWSLAKARHG